MVPPRVVGVMWHRSGVDVDALTRAREPRWARLKELTRRRRLTGAEADELTRLYQATAGDLSAVRSAAPEPALVTRLSILVAGARVWLTGAHESSTHPVRHFLLYGLAAALYRVRWWGVIVSLAVVALATLSGWWTLNHPESLALVGDAEARAAIANHEFANYYVEYDSGSFAASVWSNNWFIAAQCIALGITGIYPLILLYNTVIQLGVAGAVMAEAGLLDVFFQPACSPWAAGACPRCSWPRPLACACSGRCSCPDPVRAARPSRRRDARRLVWRSASRSSC
ncbi:hypothetical protein GCM10025876_27140 [Demequina litorisediminis]|uniref:Stage II sporulation protein M n=1 Tax=Demequina litorisediminis TaxID=1849022 RepID=A0ABQ6IGS3_9MICO|nr:hypothetical protein GCM10025876_27140 [Demequina litorisediminis]